MPEVYNWQLGRKMLYPYEERHPKWQFAFVFNINRCLACQTCSMADKSTWCIGINQFRVKDCCAPYRKFD